MGEFFNSSIYSFWSGFEGPLSLGAPVQDTVLHHPSPGQNLKSPALPGINYYYLNYNKMSPSFLVEMFIIHREAFYSYKSIVSIRPCWSLSDLIGSEIFFVMNVTRFTSVASPKTHVASPRC